MSGSAPLLYVTFHGGSGGTNTVRAIDADGTLDAKHVIESKDAKGLDELRGMCPGADGGLYVCEANKDQSRILLFDAGDADGFHRKLETVVATYVDSTGPMAALEHPYGVALAADGSLFVSDQDSGFVSWFSIGSDGTAAPQATGAYLKGLYPTGKFPAGSFVGCATSTDGWQSVAASEGGLGLTTGSEKHSVRGFAFADDLLYVADEVNDRVAAYDAGTGKFRPDRVISGNGLAAPVGIVLDPSADGLVYVGSTGGDGAVYSFAPGQAAGTPTLVGAVDSPSGLAFAGGTLYVASRKKYEIRRWTGSEFEHFVKDLPDEPECLLGSVKS